MKYLTEAVLETNVADFHCPTRKNYSVDIYEGVYRASVDTTGFIFLPCISPYIDS